MFSKRWRVSVEDDQLRLCCGIGFKIYFFVAAPCINLPQHEIPTVERVCRGLPQDQQLVTLFSENYVPVNCRSSLEGVWVFAYQVNLVFLISLVFSAGRYCPQNVKSSKK